MKTKSFGSKTGRGEGGFSRIVIVRFTFLTKGKGKKRERGQNVPRPFERARKTFKTTDEAKILYFCIVLVSIIIIVLFLPNIFCFVFRENCFAGPLFNRTGKQTEIGMSVNP